MPATAAPYNHFQFIVPGPLANLPALLAARGKTRRQIEHHQDKYAWCLAYVQRAPRLDRRLTHDDFAELHHDYARQFTGARYARPVLDDMVTWGWLECDNVYNYSKKKPKKCKGYRIPEAYQGKGVGIGVFNQEAMGKNLLKHQARDLKALNTRHLKRIHKDMLQLCIRTKEALDYLDAIADLSTEFLSERRDSLQFTKCSKKHYAALLDEAAKESPLIMLPPRKEVAKRVTRAQKKGEFTYTYYYALKQAVRQALVANSDAVKVIDLGQIPVTQRPEVRRKTGELEAYTKEVDGVKVEKFRTIYLPATAKAHRARVYTFLTNLATHLRPFLYHVKHEDEVLVNLDIRNSQPFLLNVLLNRHYEGQGLPKDVRRYMRLTASGTFYELIARVHGLRAASPRERREFKSKFFGSVFFCKISHTEGSKLGQWFMKHFPNVYGLIADNKREAYHNLAIEMQLIEANLVIDVVTTALQTRKIWCASIHDSIVCRPGDKEAVMAILADAFEQAAGIKPSIKPEPLK